MEILRTTYGSHVDTRVYFDLEGHGEVEFDLELIELCPKTKKMKGWAFNGEYEIEVGDEVCHLAHDLFEKEMEEEGE